MFFFIGCGCQRVKNIVKVVCVKWKMENIKEKNSRNSLEYTGDDITDDLEDYMDDEFNDKIYSNSNITAECGDGYTLRNLVEYLRLTNFNGRFKPYKILYERENADADENGKYLNSMVIEKHALTDYSMASIKSQMMRVSLN